MQNGFSLSFDAAETDVRAFILKVIDRLTPWGLSDDQSGSIQIALTETMNNIIEHAYAGQEIDSITLTCDETGKGLILEFIDSGRPLPGLQLPDGAGADISRPLRDLPEGGFGWSLIHMLTSDVRYERRQDQNLLQLSFDLTAAAPD